METVPKGSMGLCTIRSYRDINRLFTVKSENLGKIYWTRVNIPFSMDKDIKMPRNCCLRISPDFN